MPPGVYDSRPEEELGEALKSRNLIFLHHVKELPGSPDFVFLSEKLAIFVHGCFWHRHDQCKKTQSPSSNWERWLQSFSSQVIRDQANYSKLERKGWWVYIAWECEIRNDLVGQVGRIQNFLDQRN